MRDDEKERPDEGQEDAAGAAGISRRELLRRAAIAGGGTVFYQAAAGLGMFTSLAAQAPAALPAGVGAGRSAVVLGGGVAGLTVAHVLQKAGYRCTVLEARPIVGGRSLTLRHGDVLVERPLEPYVDTGESQSMQPCIFEPGGATGWDRPYLNAGPGRIPSAHTHLLALCKELRVPLEVYIMESRSNLVRAQAPTRVNRHVANDARGWISQALFERVSGMDELSTAEKARLRELLVQLGALGTGKVGKLGVYAEGGKYQRSDRAGYRKLPGVEPGEPVVPLSLPEVLATEFWKTRFYQPEDFLWQPTLFQPVGGMDRIVHALADAVGRQNIRTGAVVERITWLADAGEWRIELAGGEAVTAGACFSNIPLPLLREPLGDLAAQPFPAELKAAFETVFATPATGADGFLAPTTKVGWQAPRALWQEPDAAADRVVPIYGGISWTTHPITQLWYPSDRIFDELGVLTGAYNFAPPAVEWGRHSPGWRLQQARQGAAELGGDDFGAGLAAGLAIAWQNIEHLRGGWAQWQNVKGGTTAYNQLLRGDREHGFFVVGDQMSQLPGWQEGAVASALHAASLSSVLLYAAPEVEEVPDSRLLVEGLVAIDLEE